MKKLLLLFILILNACYQCAANTGYSTTCTAQNTTPATQDQFDPDWVNNQSDAQLETNYCSGMLLTEEARTKLILKIREHKIQPYCEKTVKP